MSARLWIQIVVGTVGYIAWACMSFFDHSLLPDFLKFNIAMAVGTIGLALRDMPPALPVPVIPTLAGDISLAVRQPQSQAGFARPLLLGLIAFCLALPILAMHLAPLPGPSIPFMWCGRHSGDLHCHP